MSDFLRALNSYTFTVAVNATLRDGGFAITAPGLAGKTIVTSAAVTQQILDSPDFDALLGGDRVGRILEIVLAQAAR
ncbi:hypothetical protein GCM10023172_09030 [Hymenobacter ginsengisoli]|uniref:Uncharacterized protein n=1 Tax=Hymenobacter ginsengisoli TaxID=1051626 RepID=A0ABP8Q3S7_9BACT|nr:MULTISPECIES: hypothetical protein [unclassified Hymenobacter]MBO2032522.1 hypothetical protein [Hymenobacter sp. BT559]